jgi:hypothetical protein
MSDLTPDMASRLRAVLPATWFPDDAPVLDGVLAGLGAAWTAILNQLAYVRAQTRIATATDLWLDVIAADCFAARIKRRARQGDTPFRSVIQRELLRERGTRGALIAAVTDLTGRAPTVFEPGRPADTGAWSVSAGGGLGWGVAGGWGSLTLPTQSFVTAYRPRGTGISQVAGWGEPAAGYGLGAGVYATLDQAQGQVTDADIFAAIAYALPTNAIAWTRILN